MSENENTGHTGPGGSAGPAWGWEPVPHGGEYDSDATAFVKLPQDMLDALGTGEPLAAPGHGYVPPPMIVPLGTASTDPSATGTWTMPVQWPEAGAGAPADAGAGAGASGAQAAVRAPIPASVPLPASVAAAFAEPLAEPVAEPAGEPFHESFGESFGEPFPESFAEPFAEPFAQRDAGGPAGRPGGAHDSGETAEWRFPEAAASDVWTPGGTGDTGSFGQLAASADWSRAPATLPGGAAAPWASHPDFEGARGYAAQQPGADGPGSGEPEPGFPGSDPLGTGALPGAPGAGGGPFGASPGRGPRVLGGPGVGTPLEGEQGYPAPHDIEAAHGPAQVPVTGERPHPAGEADAEVPAEVEAEAEAEVVAGGGGEAGVEAGAGGEAVAVAAEPGGGDAVPTSGGAGAAPAPGADDADIAVETAPAGTAGGAPGEGPAYEVQTADEADAEAVAHHEHPSASYVLRVNGADRPVTGAWIGESLLYVLRERLGLAGAKDGCSQGECGACAVQVDGRLVASCLVPAATAAGSEVRTVEGLATDGELSDVQQALCKSGAVQCGFCVPGMAMTIHDLLEGNHAPSELETRQALCGNLCRCSGYSGVIGAVREVVAERGAAAEAVAAATAEARIPHQAPPGEGGFHGTHGGHGMHGSHGSHGSHGNQAEHGNEGNYGNQGNHQGGTT
ncbi:2Fe-2S iron-sulfur cluster-binding protein [Streptomyces sp. NBC_00435]|uniref:2Fe-2S iron-sulfur cluster-binding protein n=1 Tax=Streptomyces sp. NBC_00435 TaxID=2903649 RepID=UPI002E23A4E9